MPSFESPALYIDFARLPPPKVIEEIDFEALLKVYQAQVLGKNPALAAALALEQSPTNIILEAESYGEMIVRERINSAARASMLPFATGSDLDVIGARFNVQRMDGELDPRLRLGPLKHTFPKISAGFKSSLNPGVSIERAVKALPWLARCCAGGH